MRESSLAALCAITLAGCSPAGRTAFDQRHDIRDELAVVDELVTSLTPGIQRSLSPRLRSAYSGLCINKTLDASKLQLESGSPLDDRLARVLRYKRGLFGGALELPEKPAVRLQEKAINEYIVNAIDTDGCGQDELLRLSRVHFYKDKAVIRFSSAACPFRPGYFVLWREEERRPWRFLATIASGTRCSFSPEAPTDKAAWFHARGFL